jgi:anti-sigma factor RsiW
MTPEQMTELMAYADGELSGDDAARVEALLERSEEARRVVAAIESPAIGVWLERASEERAAKAKADGIADAVMLRVAAEVASQAAAPRAVTSIHRRRVVTTVAFGVLALAAAGLIYVRSKGEPGKTLVAQISAPPATTTPAAEESQGIEVNEVEAPSRDVSVYYIDPPAAQTNNTVVIWIGDESKKKTGGP